MQMTKSGPSFAVLFPFAVALLAVTSAVRAEDVPEIVRVTWFGNAAPWVLGKADGTLEKRLGTKLRWDNLPTGGAVLTALAAKEVDISLLGSPPTTAGISRGLPIEVISFEGVIATSERLIARPDIKSMKDLEGKRVAYPPGSSSHYGLIAGLKSYQVDASKVKLLGLAPADMVAAWKRGDIDAGFVWSPFTYQMEADNGRELLTMKSLQPYGYFVWNNFVVRKEFADKYPGTVVAFLKAYQDYVKAYRADPAGSSRIIATYLNQDLKTVTDTLAGRDFYVLQEQLTADWMGSQDTKANAKMAKGFMDTAEFLSTNGDLKRSDIPKSFAPAINPAYAMRALQ
jgi:taurine transport system substrate-binding protein